MSLAFMTLAEDVKFQLYDLAGVNLVGSIYTLQVTNTSPSQEQGEVDLTNSRSAGLGEFVPSVTLGNFEVEGVVDPTAFFALWGVPQLHVFIQLVMYFVKDTGANDPLRFVQKALVKNIKPAGRISKEGDAWRFSCSGRSIGAIAVLGTGTTGALVQGIAPGV